MFASFTSILSPALKEKLGIGVSRQQEAVPCPLAPSNRPLSPHNKSIKRLPAETIYEVISQHTIFKYFP